MSFAHIGEIKEVSDVVEANQLIESGAELLAIVPGWTSDNTPCTLFYLGQAKKEETGTQGPGPGMLLSRARLKQ